MSGTIRFFEGNVEKYEETKNAGSLQPNSFYLVDGRPYLALSETLAFAFVDVNIVTQMIAGLSTGGGEIQLGTIGGKAPTTVGTPGTSLLAAHEDHTHTAQKNISGNAATATTAETAKKLAGAVTVRLTGAITGQAQFDGSGDCIIATTLQTEGIGGPNTWTGPESQVPSTRDSNTIYYVYED